MGRKVALTVSHDARQVRTFVDLESEFVGDPHAIVIVGGPHAGVYVSGPGYKPGWRTPENEPVGEHYHCVTFVTLVGKESASPPAASVGSDSEAQREE
jgi:hypothetical protein